VSLKGLKIITGVSLFITYFLASSQVSAHVNDETASSQHAITKHTHQKTPQQKLSTLISNYQKICASDDCHKQLIQIRKYARWGDAKSQLVIASAHLYGDGAEQNTDKAINWFKRAAYNTSSNAGKYSLHAFNVLAKIYQGGIGVEKDQPLATKYLDKLADKHYGPVLFDRAFIEFEQSNLTKGMILLEQASESGFPEASYYLARMYQQGRFVEIDINKAALYYEKTVRSNYKDSRQRLEKLISEMEISTAALPATAIAQEKALIEKLNSTLEIEVITVNYQAMNLKDAMTTQLARLNQDKGRFLPPTGTRIRGRTCGQTSYPCKGISEEEIQDTRNENPMPAY